MNCCAKTRQVQMKSVRNMRQVKKQQACSTRTEAGELDAHRASPARTKRRVFFVLKQTFKLMPDEHSGKPQRAVNARRV
jgi:hypothetical protein